MKKEDFFMSALSYNQMKIKNEAKPHFLFLVFEKQQSIIYILYWNDRHIIRYF